MMAGVPEALLFNCQDEDPEMRKLACETLRLIVQYERGSQQVLEAGGLEVLVGLLQDPVDFVRDAAYTALLEACRFEHPREALVAQETTLPMVVGKLLDEKAPHVRDKAICLLDACLNVQRNEDALRQSLEASDALYACGVLLDPSRDIHTREKAAALVARCVAAPFSCWLAAPWQALSLVSNAAAG